MELQRFLTVVNDIVTTEKKHGITQLLRDIVKNIEELRAKRDPAKGKLVEESLDKLATILQQGILGAPVAHAGIISQLKGERFYGPQAFDAINSIFTTHTFNIASITTELESYIAQREAFLKQLQSVGENLKTLGFVPDTSHEDSHEIGVSMPHALTQSDVNEISEHLRKWNIIFATFQEVVGEQVGNARVSSVSDNELTFFFAQSQSVSHCLEIVVRNITTIHEKIERVRSLRGDLKKYLPRIDEAPLEEQERDITAQQTNATVAYIMQKYGQSVKENRRSDLESAVASIVTYIADLLSNGMEVAIRTPQGDTEVKSNDASPVADLSTAIRTRIPARPVDESAVEDSDDTDDDGAEESSADGTDEAVDAKDVAMPKVADTQVADETAETFISEHSNGIFKKYFAGGKR